MNTRISSPLAGLLCGMLFGLGLALSGMTNTAKVLGFLDVLGDWDPDLLVVMASAVAVTLLSFRLIIRGRPLLTTSFALPAATAIDRRLIVGAILFGMGWGVFGYCPGPALAALVYWDVKTISFVLAMLSGMAAAGLLPKAES